MRSSTTDYDGQKWVFKVKLTNLCKSFNIHFNHVPPIYHSMHVYTETLMQQICTSFLGSYRPSGGGSPTQMSMPAGSSRANPKRRQASDQHKSNTTDRQTQGHQAQSNHVQVQQSASGKGIVKHFHSLPIGVADVFQGRISANKRAKITV